MLAPMDLPSPSELLRDYGYYGVAAGSYFDSLGLPSSGEVVVLLGAAAAATTHQLAILPVIAIAWGCAVAGDCTAYLIGRTAGTPVLRRFGVHEETSLHRFVARRGVPTVAGARLVAAFRTKVAIIAGAAHMPFHRYALADAAGALVWATLVGTAGYLGASSVERITSDFGRVSHWLGYAALAVIAALLAFLAVRRLRARRVSPEAK
jgi:membrane protein DedA with SNARE-associated domain